MKGISRIGAAVVFGSLWMGSLAATDGLRGPSSTGDFNVSVNVPAAVQVRFLEDISFGTYSAGNLDADMRFCVFSRGAQPYEISFSSQNGDGTDFIMQSSALEELPYRLTFDDDVTPNDGTVFADGDTLSNQQGSNSVVCKNSENASINIFVPAGDVNATVPGIYTDVVTVIVSAI